MTQRNQSLDLLRGVAILLVVLSHCSTAATGAVPGLTWFADKYGEHGVQLFFIVSGYTMMLTFGDRIDSAAVRSFYIRRVFRIVPLLTFFFLHWGSVTAFNSVVPGGWSIAVEMQFYLLFPLVIYLFRRRNGPVLVYAGIALLFAAGQFAAEQYLIPRLTAALPAGQAYLADGYFYCWLPRQAICFGLGILLYDFIELKNKPTFGALLLVGASFSSAWGAEVALLFALAFAVMSLNVTLSFAALLGRHSYAIYLAHFAVVSAISTLLPMGLVPLFVLVTGASLALSYYLVEPLIERRFNRLGHALAGGVRQPKAAVTAA